MKNRSIFCICMAVILIFACVGLPVEATQGNAAVGCSGINAPDYLLSPAQEIKNMKSAVLFETGTQTMLYSFNPDEPMYPASFVKIMTALIAIEQGKMDDVVSVKESVVATVPYDAVSAELLPDEIISLKDLLYCMMVDSANDAAAVIADYISGSQDAFVQEMNRYAQELGCTGTLYRNVHGLHDEQQLTTARDTARILAHAMKNEQFAELFSAIEYVVPATNKSPERELSSGNFLMNTVDGMEIYFDSRVTGGRTGVTEASKRCIAVTAQLDDLNLISVIMGSESVYEEDGYTVRSFGGFNETKQLLDLADGGFQPVQVFYANQAMMQYSVVDGDSTVTLAPSAGASTVLPENISVSDLVFRYADTGALTAPLKAGQKISSVGVWYGNLCLAEAELYALNDVAVLGSGFLPAERMNNDFWRIALIVLLCILALALVAFFTILIIRRVRIASARSRSRRYRKGRRRSR